MDNEKKHIIFDLFAQRDDFILIKARDCRTDIRKIVGEKMTSGAIADIGTLTATMRQITEDTAALGYDAVFHYVDCRNN